MSDQQEKKSHLGGCIPFIGAITALLVALGANQFFSGLINSWIGRQPPIVEPPVIPPTSSGVPVTSPPYQPLNGCILTINANNIPLMSEPNLNSQQLASLRSGRYASLGYRSINTFILKEVWFQIESEGQRGWIQDNSGIISSKSRECS
jgi:hypothetical protein